MQIPAKIKIGGLTYTVKTFEDGEADSKTGGEILVDRGLIRLAKGDLQFMEETFLHEVFHAINMELGEETTEFLAQAFYQVIVDNPDVFIKRKMTKGGEVKHG